MTWYVSRQQYWPDGTLMVEIAEGGLDYANPDMLRVRFADLGEGCEYTDPREAVEAAIRIAAAWRNTKPRKRVHIGCGHTLGFTLPFEGSRIKELRTWAKKTWEKLPKCDWCGKPLPDEQHQYTNDLGNVFCCEYCATRSAEESERYINEEA